MAPAVLCKLGRFLFVNTVVPFLECAYVYVNDHLRDKTQSIAPGVSVEGQDKEGHPHYRLLVFILFPTSTDPDTDFPPPMMASKKYSFVPMDDGDADGDPKSLRKRPWSRSWSRSHTSTGAPPTGRTVGRQ